MKAPPEGEKSPKERNGADQSGSTSSLRRIVLSALLFGGSVAVGLALGEILIRVVAPQQLIVKRPDIWKSVDGLGWTHRSNIRTTVNTGEGAVSVYTDSSGFRVGEHGPIQGDRRILIIGDSFLEAFQVEYEQTIPAFLENRLPEMIGSSVAVVNTAVGGWGPPQYLAQARLVLAKEDFDLVLVFLFLGNDIVASRPASIPPRVPKEVHPIRLPRSLRFNEIVDALLYPINDILEVRSHLFILFKTQAEVALMRLGLTAAYFPLVLLREQAGSDRWSVTADISEEIASLAAERGIPILFVLLPTSLQVEKETLERYAAGMEIDLASVDLDQPNRLMAKELGARGLELIDVLPELRAAHQRGEVLYGDVDRHFSAAGHRATARVIKPAVAEYLSSPDTE